MSIASDKKVHSSKVISIANIIGFLTLLFAQIYVYGDYREGQGKDNIRIEVLEKSSEETKKSHVEKTDLDQRFAAQEYKISVVAEDVSENKETLKDVQKMMIELLQRVQKPQ